MDDLMQKALLQKALRQIEEKTKFVLVYHLVGLEDMVFNTDGKVRRCAVSSALDNTVNEIRNSTMGRTAKNAMIQRAVEDCRILLCHLRFRERHFEAEQAKREKLRNVQDERFQKTMNGEKRR